IRGAYTFSSLADFVGGVYNNAGFTQTFGAADVPQTNPNLGIYAQDEWRAGSHVTVNAGLRYDLQWLDTISTAQNNVSPRIGAACAPAVSRRAIVRGVCVVLIRADRVQPLQVVPQTSVHRD